MLVLQISAYTCYVALFSEQIDQKIANSWKTYAFMDNAVFIESN